MLSETSNTNHFNTKPQQAKAGKCSRGDTIVRWYEYALQTHPLQTKMCTSCVLMSLGDIIAQRLKYSIKPEDAAGELEWKWDYKRTLSMSALGFFLHAPYFHNWWVCWGSKRNLDCFLSNRYKLLDGRLLGTSNSVATVAKKWASSLWQLALATYALCWFTPRRYCIALCKSKKSGFFR